MDPDGEVQLFNKQTSTTQIETLLLFLYRVHLVRVPEDVPKIELSKVFQLLTGSVTGTLSTGLERTS